MPAPGVDTRGEERASYLLGWRNGENVTQRSLLGCSRASQQAPGDRLPYGRTLVARSHVWSLTCRRSPARAVAWRTKYKKSARSSRPVFPPALGLVRGTWSALSALLEASPRPSDGCIRRTVINPCSASGSRRLRSHGLSARGLRALSLLS